MMIFTIIAVLRLMIFIIIIIIIKLLISKEEEVTEIKFVARFAIYK